MFKFILVSLQLIISLILLLFIINNSFVVSFEISEYIFSISSSYLLIVLIFFLLIIFIMQSFYFKTKFLYLKYNLNKVFKKRKVGYDSFVNGMIALANKDFKKAITESKKIPSYLDNNNRSLSLLLNSEIFKIEKKYKDLSLVYEEMIKNKNTENLGLKGMMEQYLHAQDYHHAFIYGEKLFNKNPFIEKIYDALINIISKTNNWQQLLFITEKAFSKKIIDKKIFQDNKSIALFEIANIKKHSELNQSLDNVEKALKLRKNFPPYVMLYLELLIENKSFNLAKKYLKKIWNESPHSEYKDIIKKLSIASKDNLINLTKYIIGNNLTEKESITLLAKSYIEHQKWDLAKNQITKLLDNNPKKEVCLLMAQIEEGDTGDTQKINSWKLRARNGGDKNIWICMISKKTQQEWSSVSLGGYFNSLEWKQSYMLSNFQDTINSLNHDK